jgi:hypothetical protein
MPLLLYLFAYLYLIIHNFKLGGFLHEYSRPVSTYTDKQALSPHTVLHLVYKLHVWNSVAALALLIWWLSNRVMLPLSDGKTTKKNGAAPHYSVFIRLTNQPTNSMEQSPS